MYWAIRRIPKNFCHGTSQQIKKRQKLQLLFQYIAKIIIPNNLLMLNKDAFIVHNMARCQTANSTSNTREPTRYTCTSNLLGPQTTFSFRCFMLVAWNCQKKKLSSIFFFLLLKIYILNHHLESSLNGQFWS